MLIALLALLGVDLAVIVGLIAVALLRRRWVSRQPGAFRGAIRVTGGDVPGFKDTWARGYGRWVRDVLVWSKAPLLFRNQLIPADALADPPRQAEAAELRRLGGAPTVARLDVAGGGQIEIAVPEESREQALGPFTGTSTDRAGSGPRHG